MSDPFLLVHGSAHGAWCWDHLVPALAARGRDAIAIDLPGHGPADRTRAADVTLDDYAEAIIEAADRPVVLVGHSMAGFPITLAAERAPERFSGLIYLCAHVPIAGKSIVDMRELVGPSPLTEAIRPAEDGRTLTIDPDMAPGKFYHDCPADLARWATNHLCPQPVAPQTTPFPLPLSNSLKMPRHYIRCMEDRAIPPAYQVDRTRDWVGGEVVEMQTSHSPFLSDPAALANHLIRLAP